MRKSWLCIFMAFFPLCLMAQGEELQLMKGGCTPDLVADGNAHRASRRLSAIRKDWDPAKTYHQLVILFSFSDLDFLDNHPKAYYERLFNEEGFNEGQGPGCVADYFRTQSNGLFNLQFDVYGPYKVSTKACPYEEPTTSTRYHGTDAISAATTLFLAEHPDVDFSQYDWDNNGDVDQVIYVFAGPGGNISDALGHIWPTTNYFSTHTTADGKRINYYTVSSEYFTETIPSGIGTICHEFSHSLGLPDLYPVGNNLPYASVDEWDLMDGGNYLNWGWCPPSYSSLEKMLLGWQQPIELTEATTITDMKPVSEGGDAYMIKHTDNEYLLLENRQWTGWDAGAPGKGLVIFHVNYSESAWRGNVVNSFSSEENFRYKLIPADNKMFSVWEKELGTRHKYLHDNRMNKIHLSTAPYPYEENDELTDTSVPAALMQTKNAEGEYFLSKPVTDILMSDDGLISFDLMGGTTDIKVTRQTVSLKDVVYYDLQGRQITNPVWGNVYVVRDAGGNTRKILYIGEK